MTTPIAQMMPGMEWMPLMFLLTAIGLISGLAAIVLRPFARANVAGRRCAIVALGTGMLSLVFFSIVIGREINALGYFILATPVVFGGVAVVLYPKVLKQPRGFEVLPKDTKDSEME